MAMEPDLCLPLQQHPQYSAALRQTGCAVLEVHLPGAAPVQAISRFGLTLASRGPIWRAEYGPNDANILPGSSLHVINSDGHDLAALRSAGYRQIHTPNWVAELSLSGTSSARLAAMKPKWRATLRRAEKARLRVKHDRFDPLRHGWLLSADLAQQRSKGFHSLPHAVLQAYAKASPDNALVFVASDKREPDAAMLFLVHGHVATYYLGWSGEAGRRSGAHHALLVRAWDHLARRGLARLDLGHVDTVNAPGLARFKIGTGAQVRALGGSWLRIPWL